jgi:hypothetical protein
MLLWCMLLYFLITYLLYIRVLLRVFLILVYRGKYLPILRNFLVLIEKQNVLLVADSI